MPLVERLIEETSGESLTLDQIKNWLKVEHDLDDDILLNLRDVTIHEAFNFMQNDFEEISEENGELVQIPIPFTIKLACLMALAYLYENRGEENTALPLNCIKLLSPYKKLVGL